MAARGLTLFSLLALSCCHAKPVAVAEPAPPQSAASWDGTARNAKLGAVLVTDQGTLWIDGLTEWPSDLDGKRVHVEGALETRKDLPVFVPKPGEPQKTGIPVEEGADLDQAATRTVIVRAKWTLSN